MCMGRETGSLSLATHTCTHAHTHAHTHTHMKQLQCGLLVVAISGLSEDRPGRKKKESQ